MSNIRDALPDQWQEGVRLVRISLGPQGLSSVLGLSMRVEPQSRLGQSGAQEIGTP